MAGTYLGGLKAAKTNKETQGEDFYRIIGARGGKKTMAQGAKPKGFAAMLPEKRKELGRQGGSVTGDRYKTRSYA